MLSIVLKQRNTATMLRHGFKVVLTGLKVEEGTLTNTWLITYDNDCEVFSLFTKRQFRNNFEKVILHVIELFPATSTRNEKNRYPLQLALHNMCSSIVVIEKLLKSKPAIVMMMMMRSISFPTNVLFI